MLASLLAVEKTFSIHGESGAASPSPCCTAEMALSSCAGQGWAQPQFGTSEGSGLCPPRGAGEWARGQAGRGHAGGMQPPSLVLIPKPQADGGA